MDNKQMETTNQMRLLLTMVFLNGDANQSWLMGTTTQSVQKATNTFESICESTQIGSRTLWTHLAVLTLQ